MINKEIVRNKFKKSLKTYTDEAFVQRKMAVNLKGKLVQICGKDFQSVFEIGCGTGILTEMLINSLNYKEYRANDLVDQCLEFVKPYIDELHFYPGDAESGQLIANNQDLIISNAVFQWFIDLEKVLKTLFSKLNKNGILAFTTFSKGNLKEVRTLTNSGLPYFSKEEILNLSSPYYDCIYCGCEDITVFFKSPMKVLKHFKKTGVNAVGTKAMNGKQLKEFINKYEKQFGNEGSVSLTYTPMTFIFRRK